MTSHQSPPVGGVGVDRWLNAAGSFVSLLTSLLRFPLSSTLCGVFWDARSYLSWALVSLSAWYRTPCPLFRRWCQYFYVTVFYVSVHYALSCTSQKSEAVAEVALNQKWGRLCYHSSRSLIKFYQLPTFLSNKLPSHNPGTSAYLVTSSSFSSANLRASILPILHSLPRPSKLPSEVIVDTSL